MTAMDGRDLSGIMGAPSSAVLQTTLLGQDASWAYFVGLRNRGLPVPCDDDDASDALGLPRELLRRMRDGDPTLTLAEVARVTYACGLIVSLDARPQADRDGAE